MREIVHIQAGQCGNQIGAKVSYKQKNNNFFSIFNEQKYEFATTRKKKWKKETNCSNLHGFFSSKRENCQQHVKSCLRKKKSVASHKLSYKMSTFLFPI